MSESIANGVFVNEYVVIADTLFTYSGQKPSRFAIKECFGEQAYGYEDYAGFRRFNKQKYDGRFNIILTCEPEIWPGFSVDFLYNSNERSSKNLGELPDTLTVTITTWKDDRVYERFKLKKKHDFQKISIISCMELCVHNRHK